MDETLEWFTLGSCSLEALSMSDFRQYPKHPNVFVDFTGNQPIVAMVASSIAFTFKLDAETFQIDCREVEELYSKPVEEIVALDEAFSSAQLQFSMLAMPVESAARAEAKPVFCFKNVFASPYHSSTFISAYRGDWAYGVVLCQAPPPAIIAILTLQLAGTASTSQLTAAYCLILLLIFA